MSEGKNTGAGNKRDFVYAEKAQTSILLEQASDSNPYVSKSQYLHGYDVLELMAKKSFVETLLLLFTGELPESEKVKLLEYLMIGLMNLGPRHPAVKAAMVAGVSKANTEHLLPIGLSVLGGQSNGAKEVELSVLFLQQHRTTPVEEVIAQLLSTNSPADSEGEFHLCPGFGNSYGSKDEFTETLALQIFADFDEKERFPVIAWARKFHRLLGEYDMGFLKTGLAASIFCELGIPAREASGFFQLICAPGIFAHGVEQTHQPITAIPMLSDENHLNQD